MKFIITNLSIYIYSVHKKIQKMESQSDQVVQVKRDEVQCNHRIDKLFSHRNCTKNAEICEHRCKSNLIHDYSKFQHEVTSVNQFKIKFTTLEETSTKETQHYIRQLDDIERNALENIAKKKQECLNQMNDFKRDLMRQTYADLEKTFPNLIEKFKSQRFDTLSCNEVFWVMNTNKHQHHLKPSQINSKLLAILKKFETFKDVSKNISPKIIVNKQKAKDIKIVQKGLQPVIKVKNNINLEKPNYSQDKSKEQLFYLEKRKSQLDSMIKNLSEQHRRLSNEISDKIYFKREKQNRMKIFSRIISINLQSIREPFRQSLNNRASEPEENSDSSELSAQIHQRLMTILNKNQIQQNQQNPTQTMMVKSIQQTPVNITTQNIANKNDKNDDIDPRRQMSREVIEQQNLEKSVELEMQFEQSQQNQNNQTLPHNQAQNKPQEIGRNAPEQNNLPPILQQSKTNQEEHKVKIQPDPSIGFQPWKDKQLVDQMKKYGQSEDQCLKVENIEGIRKFGIFRLSLPKTKINPYLKNRYLGQNNTQKPKSFQLCALELFQKQCQRKTENSDKKQ